MAISVRIAGSAYAAKAFQQYPPPQTTGWTDPVPSTDSRVVYVSSLNGLDSNSGLLPTLPKLTPLAGIQLLRPGFPDWILFERGSMFSGLGYLTTTLDVNGIPLSGRSPSERMVFGAYGTGARPIFNHGTNGIGAQHNPSSALPLNYVYILGLDFFAHTNTNGTGSAIGICISKVASHIHIEDCLARSGAYGISFQDGAAKSNVVVRRNVVRDTQSFSGGSGIDIRQTSGLVIEDNFVDYAGANIGSNASFRHGIYVGENCTNVIRIKNNVVTRPSAVGIFATSGYPVQDNVIVQAPYGIINGSVGTQYVVGGVPVACDGNLVLEGLNYRTTPVVPAGVGIVVYNCSAGTVLNNILTQNAGTFVNQGALIVQDDGARPVQNLTIKDNRSYKWNRGYRFQGAGNLFGVTMQDNDIQEPTLTGGATQKLVYLQNGQYPAQMIAPGGNRYDRGGVTTDWFRVDLTDMNLATFKTAIGDTTSTATPVTYPGAANTLGTYHGSIGGTATTQGYIDSRRARHRFGSGATLWADNLNAPAILSYFRTAFP